VFAGAAMAAVRGAEPSVERSGPPCHSVDGWAHPAEARGEPFMVVIGTPAFCPSSEFLRQRAVQIKGGSS
jgi:hypothetical protein